MQSSSDPRGLFRCCNRVVVIKPSPKPWGCWHAAGVTSASLSPRSSRIPDSRRRAGDASSTPEVCRGCDNISFVTLPEFPLAFNSVERCDADPRSLHTGMPARWLPLLSTSAAVGVAPSYPPKQITALRIQESSQIQQRVACRDDPRCLFSWLKNTSLCKESLHSHLVGCPGRRHTYEEPEICVCYTLIARNQTP